MVQDVVSGIEYLKSRKEIDPARIGLIGHSEGGIIAARVAAQYREVAFIVMLAAPGLPGKDVVQKQQSALLRAAGAPDNVQRVLNATLNDVLSALLADDSEDRVGEFNFETHGGG